MHMEAGYTVGFYNVYFGEPLWRFFFVAHPIRKRGYDMKTIMITAPSSGSGKTTVTMGILRALSNMGLDLCSFKTGPDYIDRGFLEQAGKCKAGNLDMHLQGECGMQTALSLVSAEYCIIEGAMGYFDGIYNTFENSSYDISKELGIDSVLIYTPKGEMLTAVAKIKGMAEFESSNIKAVIFNNVTKKHYEMLKEATEAYTSIKVLGFVEKLKEVELKSRHLGLVQNIEIDEIESKMEAIAGQIQHTVDLQGLLKLMKDIKIAAKPAWSKRNIKVAIAKDKAFSFYYTENLILLEEICQVEYFSPLKDSNIPHCDLLYLGGGYPEVYREELSSNKAMLAAIKSYAEQGGFVYAECGGFMYLTEAIEGTKMAGIFKGESRLTEKLQNFGYIDMTLSKDCFLGKQGDYITAHEFHKSVTAIDEEAVLQISKTRGINNWKCGYLYRNTYGGYPHISFVGNVNVLNHILSHIERSKRQ